MRYVNEISLPGKSLASSEVLHYFNPIINQERIKEDKPFRFNNEYRTRHDTNYVLTRRNALMAKEAGGDQYVIDIDSFISDSVVPHSELESSVDSLHTLASNEFHRNIKDSFIAILRGGDW